MNKNVILVIILINLLFLVSASTPYKGELHVYTGFRSGQGYGYNPPYFPPTPDSACSMAGWVNSFNITQLKSIALAKGVQWQGYSDETYCLNSTEFNTVRQDCQNAQDGSFTCLHGETLPTKDDVESSLSELYCLYCTSPSLLCSTFGGYGSEPINNYRAGRIGGYGSSTYYNPDENSPPPEQSWCRTSIDPQQGINNITSRDGLSIIHTPFGEGALYGIWDFESIDTVNNYKGIELWNYYWDNSDQAALNWWVTNLIQDKKIYAYSGIGNHFFNSANADVYNVAYLQTLNQSSLKDSINRGYSTISNNGEMKIEIRHNGNVYHMGETINVTENIRINVSVTFDLDNSCNLRILKGQIGGIEAPQQFPSISGSGTRNITNIITDDSYFRAECINGDNRAYTNPIWVDIVSASCSCGSWSSGSCSAGGCGANERLQTRTCTPSVCAAESQCVPDVSCLGGSTLITVCASGCSYTTIQAAIDNSNPGDHINVTDSRNYAENLVIDSGDAEWLECSAGANISRNSGVGINVVNPSTVDDIYIRGCTIKNFGTGILLNHTTNARLENLSFINVGTSIYLDDDSDSNKIINNTISVSQDYGIFLAGTSWAGPSLNQIKYNKVFDSAVYGLWFKWGLQSQVIGNTINGSDDSGDFGFWFNGGGLNLDSDIYNNTIYSNDIGFDNRGDNNRIFGNIFCPTNPNGDIVISGSSSGLSGDYNTCDLPSTWNDAGTTGCRYSCNSPPIVNLVSPLNGSIIGKKDFNFTCYAEDATQLVNLSLYHNSTGIWHLNQSSVISGLSNSTTFMVRNLTQDVAFNWNCLTSDGSKSAFAAINWTVRVNLTNVAPTVPKELWCNGVFCNFNFTYSSNLNVSCAGSVDDDEDEITYSLDAFYSSVWSHIGNHTQSSQLGWNISAINAQSNVSLRCKAIDLLGSNSYSPFYSPSMSLKIYNSSLNDTNRFIVQNSSASDVAWLGDSGNIVLKGTCSISTNCVAPDGSLIIANSTDDSTAYIDLNGNLCLESGSCTDQSAFCNPTRDAFKSKEDFMYWYNDLKPHRSLNFDELETM